MPEGLSVGCVKTKFWNLSPTLSLHTAPDRHSALEWSYSGKNWEICVRLSLRLSPTRWNVTQTLPHTLGDSRAWWRDRDVQSWRLTPHTLLHNTTRPFLIPLPHIPLFKCVPSWTVQGGQLRGAWGYQVSFKKAVVRTGWKWRMTLFSLNCSLLKTAWPLSALLQWSGHFYSPLRVGLMELY